MIYPVVGAIHRLNNRDGADFEDVLSVSSVKAWPLSLNGIMMR